MIEGKNMVSDHTIVKWLFISLECGDESKKMPCGIETCYKHDQLESQTLSDPYN